jgi:hypothetical protein
MAYRRIKVWIGILTVALPVFWFTGGTAQTVRKSDPDETGELRSIPLIGANDEALAAGVRIVLDGIVSAWLAGDHTALSAAISPEGVLIAIAPQADRENLYSPSQAFYFFKNLFHSTRTDSFRILRQQDQADAGLIHAIADWHYRRTGSDAAVSERLFFTLSRVRTGWGLTEIRAVR